MHIFGYRKRAQRSNKNTHIFALLWCLSLCHLVLHHRIHALVFCLQGEAARRTWTFHMNIGWIDWLWLVNEFNLLILIGCRIGLVSVTSCFSLTMVGAVTWHGIIHTQHRSRYFWSPSPCGFIICCYIAFFLLLVPFSCLREDFATIRIVSKWSIRSMFGQRTSHWRTNFKLINDCIVYTTCIRESITLVKFYTQSFFLTRHNTICK